MNKVIRYKICAIWILIAIVLSGCGWLMQPEASPEPTPYLVETPDGAHGSPVKAATLRVGAPLPGTLHPLQVRYPEWISLYHLLFPSLYTLDEGLKATPSLVESASQTDDLHWSFSLSRSFAWQDGTPVTAQDVAATLAWLVPDSGGDYPMDSPWNLSAGLIQSYSVAEDDPYRLDIALNRPAGYLPWLLSFPVLPAHIYGGVIPDMSTITLAAPALVGCGPYRVTPEECTDGVLVCKRTGGGEPGIARIEMTAIAGYLSGLTMVYDGALDFVNIPTNTYVGEMEPGIGIYPYHTGEYQYIALSASERSPKEAAILQAALYVLDRKQIMNAVYFGNAALVDSPLRPDTWVYDPEYQWYDYDPDLADEILTQAGWVDLDGDDIREDIDEVVQQTPTPEVTDADMVDNAGENAEEIDPRSHCTLRLLVEEENDLARQTARLMRDQLEKVGIEVDIKVLPWEGDGKTHGSYLDVVQMDQYDMALAGAYIQSLPIPDELFVYWPQVSEIPEDALWEDWEDSLPPAGLFPYTSEVVQGRFASVSQKTDTDAVGYAYRKIDRDGVWQSLTYSLFYRLGHIGVSPKLMGIGPVRQTDLFMGIGEWYFVK